MSVTPKPKKTKLTRSEALRELARRRGLLDEPGTFRLENYLFDKQLAFVRDPSDFKAAVTTRRSGKTEGCAADLNDSASRSEDYGVFLYITINRKMAKRNIWPKLKMINRMFVLAGVPNESDLTITYPKGGIIMCLGAEDRGAIENLRGLAIKKAYLDEVQSFPEYIRELIDLVIGPALMDYQGQLILIGTPGPVPAGYFYDLTNPASPNYSGSGCSKHTWSFFDNPKMPYLKLGKTHQDALQRELDRRGVTTADPSIQREWFGRWVTDENSLVFHCDKRNDYDVLPEGNWHYLIGLDLGFKDADAIAVLAYSDSHPATYLVAEKITRGQDISALVSQIDDLCRQYPVDKIVVDAGGLGKKITEEISKRFSVPMVAAEKIRKMEYIELMNDAMRTGRLMIKATSQFALDSLKIEWDQDRSTPERKVVSDRCHSDICDAVLYAWRESYSYTYQKINAEPEFGTKAWSDAESDKMFNAELERLEEAKTVEDELRERYTPEANLDVVQRLDRPKLRYQARFDKRRKL